MFLPGEAGEVAAKRSEGGMGNRTTMTHDPSAPTGHLPTRFARREEDYRRTVARPAAKACCSSQTSPAMATKS